MFPQSFCPWVSGVHLRKDAFQGGGEGVVGGGARTQVPAGWLFREDRSGAFAERALGSPTPALTRAMLLLSAYYIQLNHKVVYIYKVLLREKKRAKLETHCYLFLVPFLLPSLNSLSLFMT